MDLHTYAQLIFDEGTKAFQCRKDSLFNKCCWCNWTSIGKNEKKKELSPKFMPYTKIKPVCHRFTCNT